MSKKTFTSLEKAVDILDLYDINKRDFTAKEISEALDVPLSSIYKYIEFLLKRQLLRHKPNTKLYGLGFMISRLNYVLEKDLLLVDLAKPHLLELCRITGETSILTMIIGEEVVTLDLAEPQRLVRFSLERGRRLPMHIGSTSKILLAYQNKQFIENYLTSKTLIKLTDNSVTDPKKLRADLEQIRRDGYCLSDSEVDYGAKAISVPIFDLSNSVIAGLTVAGPSERINGQQVESCLLMLKEKAELISKDLGVINKN